LLNGTKWAIQCHYELEDPRDVFQYSDKNRFLKRRLTANIKKEQLCLGGAVEEGSMDQEHPDILQYRPWQRVDINNL